MRLNIVFFYLTKLPTQNYFLPFQSYPDRHNEVFSFHLCKKLKESKKLKLEIRQVIDGFPWREYADFSILSFSDLFAD